MSQPSLSLNKQFDQTHHYHALTQLAQTIESIRIEDLLEQDPKRCQEMSLDLDPIFMDYSKQLVTQEVMEHLFALANQQGLASHIEQLFKGANVNTTESRPAWHSALRQVLSSQKDELPQQIQDQIMQSHEQMRVWSEALGSGHKGATGKKIQDIVHVGIGGSDLGPRLLLDALKPFHQSDVRIHFVSNLDPQAMLDCLEHCQPESTFFILASKSFTTQETLENAELAKRFLAKKMNPKQIFQHFLAITANESAALTWGLKSKQVLPLWDWVGGRFSVWSSISLPIAIKIGFKHFQQFLEGGYAMDKHFRYADFKHNMPVIMALLGIWYNNFLNWRSLAVLPYSHRLKLLPSYLQQLDMESNGKSLQNSADRVNYSTGPIIWGGAGTDGQHAYYQLLHQGTHQVPMDFILIAKSDYEPRQHNMLLAHGIAQTRAFMIGQQGQTPHDFMPGNKPSSTFVFKELSPYTLGMLIALYEHKVFVQGVLWQINSFDQPGVQLGKKLANEVFAGFESDDSGSLDCASLQIMKKIKQYQAS